MRTRLKPGHCQAAANPTCPPSAPPPMIATSERAADLRKAQIPAARCHTWGRCIGMRLRVNY